MNATTIVSSRKLSEIMSNFLVVSILVVCAIAVGGCSKKSAVRPDEFSNEGSGACVKCLALYQQARSSCEAFIAQERNPVVKDQLMIRCLEKKGFPDSESHCEALCR